MAACTAKQKTVVSTNFILKALSRFIFIHFTHVYVCHSDLTSLDNCNTRDCMRGVVQEGVLNT